MGSRRPVFPFDRNAVKVVDYNVDRTGECDQDDNGGGENNPGTLKCMPPKLLSLSLSLSFSLSLFSEFNVDVFKWL